MIINEFHIAAFGGLVDREILLDKGLNIIEGANESGKTSAAAFIKFIFYGLSGKSAGGGLSERKRYVNFQKGTASGYLICTENGVKYRIERTLYANGGGDSAVRETVRIVNLSDGSIINGGTPGEYFFGVNESMFVNTVFVGQLSNLRPDGDGLGGAVENMLCTADENVNLKKAAERLNAARREIQHKNGGGGELASLKEERALLSEEARRASASSAELIELEASLADAVKKKEQLEKRKEKLDGVFKALDVILVKKKLDAVKQTEGKIARLRESVEAIDRSGFLESYEEVLDAAERDVRAYRETSDFYAEKRDYEISAASVEGASGDASSRNAAEEASYLDTKCRAQFSVAIAMLIVGFLGIAAAGLMYYFNTDAYALPFGIAAVAVVCGIAFFVFHARALRALYAILDEWKVETLDDLEAAVEAASSGKGSDLYRGAMDELKAKAEAAEEIVRAMASGVGVEVRDDPCETAAAIRRYAEKLAEERDVRKARIENFSGRLAVLKEQIASVNEAEAEKAAAETAASPYGKLALSLDTEGIKKAIRERDFTQSAYKSQTQRVAELEKRLSEIKIRTKSPAEAATRIEEIDERINELELKRDGYNLAVEALKKAGENMRSGVVPRLTAYASEIMGEVVDGKYNSLLLDSSFSMNYIDGTETRSVEYMSRGTCDAAYIALRLALMRVVFRNAMPPVVLDESFAYIDEERFANLLRCVSRSDGQSLFFTCRERAAVEANQEALRYNRIKM